jgi:hypothetical protein
MPDNKLFRGFAYAYRTHLEKLKSLCLLDSKMAIEALLGVLSKTFNLSFVNTIS